MFTSIPSNKNYRRLFLAQIISLAGTGVSTIALALLAHSIAEQNAGIILGIALGIKMAVYVFFTPIISFLVSSLPRRSTLIGLDIARSVIVISFFFATHSWHVYILIFLLNLGAAGFTPLFQATIPDLLTDEDEYNRALSLSRMAYDLENIASPVLAGIILSRFSFSYLFIFDSASFILSAMIIFSTVLPIAQKSSLPDKIWYRIKFGVISYQHTPRLRYSLVLIWIVSFASAMVIVNTVIIVKEILQGTEQMVANAFVFSGAGSILGAAVTPFLITRISEKFSMMLGIAILIAGLTSSTFIAGYALLFSNWFIIGLGWSLVQTPAGQLIKKSSRPEDRTSYFSAHFALSHFGWLIAYPIVGIMGKYIGICHLFQVLAATALVIFIITWLLWNKKYDSLFLEHSHAAIEHTHWHEHDTHHKHHNSGDKIPDAHSHRHKHPAVRHAHYYVIDHHHRTWLS